MAPPSAKARYLQWLNQSERAQIELSMPPFTIPNGSGLVLGGKTLDLFWAQNWRFLESYAVGT